YLAFLEYGGSYNPLSLFHVLGLSEHDTFFAESLVEVERLEYQRLYEVDYRFSVHDTCQLAAIVRYQGHFEVHTGQAPLIYDSVVVGVFCCFSREFFHLFPCPLATLEEVIRALESFSLKYVLVEEHDSPRPPFAGTHAICLSVDGGYGLG